MTLWIVEPDRHGVAHSLDLLKRPEDRVVPAAAAAERRDDDRDVQGGAVGVAGGRGQQRRDAGDLRLEDLGELLARAARADRRQRRRDSGRGAARTAAAAFE
jgi:hypothetical protein